PGSQQPAGIVTRRLDIAGAAGKCADEVLLSEQPDRLAKIGTDGTSEYYQAIVMGRPYEQSFIEGEIDGPNVQSAPVAERGPILIQPNQLGYALEEQVLGDIGHCEPGGGAV